MLGIIAVSLVVLLVTYRLWSIRQKTGKMPPGPSPLLSFPIIGHGLLLKEDPIGKFYEFQKKYGNIFRLDLGSSRTVFLSDFKLITEAAKSEVCQGRPYENSSGIKYVRHVDSTGTLGGVTGSSGKVWQEQRKFMLHNLSDLGMGNKDTMEGIITEEAEYLCGRISKGEKKLRMNGLFLTATNNVIWRIVTGKRTKQDDPELVLLTTKISKMFDAMDPGSLLYLLQLSNQYFLRLCAFLGFPNFLDNLGPLYESVENEVKTKHEDPNGNMIERLHAELEKNKDNFGSSFYGGDGQVHLRGQMFDFLIAGTDTVSTMLEWSLLYMAMYPEVQERIHKEIKECFGIDGSISLADDFRLPYLLATMEEIGRHAPAAVAGVPHETTAEFPIGGYILPKGTQIFLFAGAVHKDPNHFPNPEKFDPTRFLDNSGSHFQKNDHMLTFGTGKRKCVGERLGRAELFLFLANLLQKFKFCKVSEDQVLNLDYVAGLVFHPKPFDLVVEERK